MSSIPESDARILIEALGIAWDDDHDTAAYERAASKLFGERPVVARLCERARESHQRNVDKHGSASWRDDRHYTIEDTIYNHGKDYTYYDEDGKHHADVSHETLLEQLDWYVATETKSSPSSD